MKVKVNHDDRQYRFRAEVFDRDYVENLVVDNYLMTETLNYIFLNMLSKEQIEHIILLSGKRNIRQAGDGTYAWLPKDHASC